MSLYKTYSEPFLVGINDANYHYFERLQTTSIVISTQAAIAFALHVLVGAVLVYA